MTSCLSERKALHTTVRYIHFRIWHGEGQPRRRRDGKNKSTGNLSGRVEYVLQMIAGLAYTRRREGATLFVGFRTSKELIFLELDYDFANH